MMPMIKKNCRGRGIKKGFRKSHFFILRSELKDVKIFGIWTLWIRPTHVWVVAPALEEPKVLRENTGKVVIFLKNAILGRRWAPV